MANTSVPVIRLHDLFRIAEWQEKLRWEALYDGVDIYRLYDDGGHGARAALLRYRPGGRVPPHEHLGFEHILVLAGEQTDEAATATAGTLTISPPGTHHGVSSETGCIVLAIYEKPVRIRDVPSRR
jgi:anti-sigma factor ChrR (cupin superfamily)